MLGNLAVTSRHGLRLVAFGKGEVDSSILSVRTSLSIDPLQAGWRFSHNAARLVDAGTSPPTERSEKWRARWWASVLAVFHRSCRHRSSQPFRMATGANVMSATAGGIA